MTQANPGPRSSDFFGVVGRDPWYEFNTNPAYPNALNQAFLNAQFDHVQNASLGWMRFEFHADTNGTPSGVINWQKWDWFVAEANRRGIKLLALLGSGIITENVIDLLATADAADGTNAYIRNFVARADEIATRYKGQLAAWEILNEPNVNAELNNATHGSRQSIGPDRFGTLLAKVYRGFAAIGETAPLLIGGLYNATPVENRSLTPAAYLQELYSSRPIHFFSQDVGRFPWSGIAVHPYPDFTKPGDLSEQVFNAVNSIYQTALQNHDPALTWITEVGRMAEPAQPNAIPTFAEIDQTDFLLRTTAQFEYRLAGAVARWFWFKLEDFMINNTWYNWGLLRLAQGATPGSYDPNGAVYRYKTAYASLANLAAGNAVFIPPSRPSPFPRPHPH